MMLPPNVFTETRLLWSIFDIIPDAYIDPGDYLVLVEYKYDHEKNLNYDISTMSIFDPVKQSIVNDDKGSYLDTDLWEGQEYFKIIAYTDLSLSIDSIKGMLFDLDRHLKEKHNV